MGDTDRLIASFLWDNNYESLEAWMKDSDYVDSPRGWRSVDNIKVIVDPIEQVWAAMESSGYLGH